MKIVQKTFNKLSASELSSKWYGKNWPVVYILNNKKEAYIGETTSISSRMRQHLENPLRENLYQSSIIVDERFNKSAILDIEAKLIEYMSADQKFLIQNSNSGMRNHNYYDKPIYDSLFKSIWNALRSKKIVDQDIDVIYNSDIFKYTPYKSLTHDQYTVLFDLVISILDSMLSMSPSTAVINGEAGTGKTVLAMYLLKLFSDNKVIEFLANEDDEYVQRYESLSNRIGNFKIGLVVPMTSLRGTLKRVARGIEGLNAQMIIGPNDVGKEKFDLLIIDESHRLYRRIGITGYGSYDSTNQLLGFDKTATQLDWIIEQSRHNVFFYDVTQSVRPSDIRKEDFQKLKSLDFYSSYAITSQLRVLGGEDYIQYVTSILNGSNVDYNEFRNYDFRLFDSIKEMKECISDREREFGLSRMVAGYAWQWKSKGKSYEKAVSQNIYDIEIDDERFIWNTTNSSWVISKNATREVGSIHTIQGYDLNYVAVIIGSDLTYDNETQQLKIIKDNYYDSKGKTSLKSLDELKEYILNIYKVLLTRGIRGTYVYVTDPNLREYMRKYIPIK